MTLDVDPNCTAWTNLQPDEQSRLETIAMWLIWALSGRRYGQETITVRPVQPWPSLPTNRPSWPYGRFPVWSAYLGPLPLLGSGYTDERAIARLDGPVAEVLTVKVDGTVLDPSAYTVFDGQYLVRTDGKVWPQRQKLTDPDTAENTWSVRYTRGKTLPPSGSVAAGTYACELAKAQALDNTCRLPERTQKVSRDGIDVEFLDPQDFVKDGRTGVTEVDQWLHAINPAKIAQGAQVWSPDLPKNHRVQP
jgi:hypothetical protein